MAVSTNNILGVKFFHTQGGNEALVTSFWKVNVVTVPNTYAAIAEMMAYMYMVTGKHAEVLSIGSELVRVIVDNYTIPGEFGEWNGDLAGTVTGDVCPPFVALSIKQSCESRITRAGWKRIPFLAEASVSGSTPVFGVTTREALKFFWEGNVLYTWDTEVDGLVSLEMSPVVVGRTLDPLTDEYFLDLTKINIVDRADLVNITSQTSRKL